MEPAPTNQPARIATRLSHPVICRLFHGVENRADNSANYAALHRLPALVIRHVFLQFVGTPGDGQRLQPDSAGTGERGEKDSVAAENHVLDSRNSSDLE